MDLVDDIDDPNSTIDSTSNISFDLQIDSPRISTPLSSFVDSISTKNNVI